MNIKGVIWCIFISYSKSIGKTNTTTDTWNLQARVPVFGSTHTIISTACNYPPFLPCLLYENGAVFNFFTLCIFFVWQFKYRKCLLFGPAYPTIIFAGIIFNIFVFSTIYGAAAAGDQHSLIYTHTFVYFFVTNHTPSSISYKLPIWSAYWFASTLTMHASTSLFNHFWYQVFP